MKFQESYEQTKAHRQDYLDGLENLIQCRNRELKAQRPARLEAIMKEPEAHRKAACAMLGWPLTEVRSGLPQVQEERLCSEGKVEIYRLRFEILEGVWLAGLLFRQKSKAPMVLCQHGGLGTPELIAGFYGNSYNYNDMIDRVLAQGVHIFAPQLLLWAEQYEVPFNRQVIDFRLKRLGSSVAAVELYGLMRVLDYFEAQEYCGKLGMVGLSYGGFYTQYLTALDPRIQSAVACSWVGDRDAFAHSDLGWFNSGALYEDAELTCMVYPRRICLEMGTNDDIFSAENSKETYDSIPIKGDWVELILFDGKHEFCRDDAPLRRLAEDLRR